MKIERLIFYLIPIILLLSSCSSDEDDAVICTLEFKIIGITVIGDSLTDFYTIRNSRNDTLRIPNLRSENFYPVLSDGYSAELTDMEDNFTFIGLKNDSVLVREEYVIGADKCHINKISGANKITL